MALSESQKYFKALDVKAKSPIIRWIYQSLWLTHILSIHLTGNLPPNHYILCCVIKMINLYVQVTDLILVCIFILLEISRLWRSRYLPTELQNSC